MDLQVTWDDRQVQRIFQRINTSIAYTMDVFTMDIAKRMTLKARAWTPVYLGYKLSRTKTGKVRRRKDTGEAIRSKIHGGRMKKSWTDPILTHSGGFTQATITNTAVSDKGFPYPVIIEIGSGIGEKPWPMPAGRTMTFRSPYDGDTRVYSRQAPGGVSFNVYREFDAARIATTFWRMFLRQA